MEMISFKEFMRRTLRGRPNQMIVRPYIGHRFECACGVSHSFDPITVKVLRELLGMQLVFACPQSDSVTCVKVKGILRFNGFESLFGFRAPEEPASQTAAFAESESLSSQLNSVSATEPVYGLSPSNTDLQFLRERVAYAEELARELWVGSCHLTAMPTQPRHSLNVAVLAIATAQVRNVKSSELIDFAAEHIQDADFHEFIRRPDVRKGLRSLVAHARAAAQAADALAMASIVQTVLLLPLGGGPSRPPPSVAESIVSCAAEIVAHTATLGFSHPRAKLSRSRSRSSAVPTPPSQGPVADFLLDSQRALFGEPTSRPMSGLVKVIMGIIGFIAFVGVVNALNTTCSHILH